MSCTAYKITAPTTHYEVELFHKKTPPMHPRHHECHTCMSKQKRNEMLFWCVQKQCSERHPSRPHGLYRLGRSVSSGVCRCYRARQGVASGSGGPLRGRRRRPPSRTASPHTTQAFKALARLPSHLSSHTTNQPKWWSLTVQIESSKCSTTYIQHLSSCSLKLGADR